MMPRLLTLLWPGLLLVCCDKPGESSAREETAAPASPVERRQHSPRQPSQGTPAALRELLDTAVGIDSAPVRDKALADVAWNALEIDPELAVEAFQHLTADSPEKIRLVQHYAMRLAEQDPDEALAWAEALGSEQEIAAAKSRIALVLAETDPQRAANLLSESGISGRDFDVAVVQVVQRWAARSPPDAAAWVVLFPPGEARPAAIKIIVEQWLPRDPSAVFGWLDTMQDEGLRKETARGMEGIILQQPKEIRDAWLQHADAGIRSELDQQREPAIGDVGGNLPPSGK